MTDSGVLEFVDRLRGTYPLQYKGFTSEEINRIRDEAKRNYQGYSDDEVYDALSAYINSPDSKMPPSPGQLKSLMLKKAGAEKTQDWDKTRLVVDENGYEWYNQLYEEVKSEVDPRRTVLKPVPGSRPFDGKKGYKPVRVPRSDEELVEICKRRGWKYEVHERENGSKSYTYGEEMNYYLDNERFLDSAGNIEKISSKVFKEVV